MKITEKMEVHKKWYLETGEQDLETLPKFLKDLMEEYEHDYGTVCHALAAGAIATMWAMDKHKQGGITGFQASAIMWQIIKQWMYKSNKLGLSIIDYDNLLYPQSESKFEISITEGQRIKLVEEAKNKLENTPNAHPNVITHWKSIVAGNIPFNIKLREE